MNVFLEVIEYWCTLNTEHWTLHIIQKKDDSVELFTDFFPHLCEYWDTLSSSRIKNQASNSQANRERRRSLTYVMFYAQCSVFVLALVNITITITITIIGGLYTLHSTHIVQTPTSHCTHMMKTVFITWSIASSPHSDNNKKHDEQQTTTNRDTQTTDKTDRRYNMCNDAFLLLKRLKAQGAINIWKKYEKQIQSSK